MAIAPAHVVAIALGLFGAGLVAASLMGDSFGALRLFGGITLLVIAFITSGVQLLTRNAAASNEEET